MFDTLIMEIPLGDPKQKSEAHSQVLFSFKSCLIYRISKM